MENISTEEFLKISFILLKKKLLLIYSLCLDEQTVDVVKSRFEKTSEVLEALRQMNSSLDFSLSGAENLSKMYLDMQLLIMKGNSENPFLLKKLAESL